MAIRKGWTTIKPVPRKTKTAGKKKKNGKKKAKVASAEKKNNVAAPVVTKMMTTTMPTEPTSVPVSPPLASSVPVSPPPPQGTEEFTLTTPLSLPEESATTTTEVVSA
jgi:hypothetical protein